MSNASGTSLALADFALEELEPRQEPAWFLWYCSAYWYEAAVGTWLIHCVYYWA